MKKTILLLTLLFFLINCNGQELKIQIFNKTGFDVDSIYIGDKVINQIKCNDSIWVLDCKSLVIQDGVAWSYAGGNIKSKTRDKKPPGHCGTGIKTVNSGNYFFDLILIEGENRFRIYYENHKISTR